MASSKIIFFMFLVFWCNVVHGLRPLQSDDQIHDITEFGAVADGETDNSEPLLSAWEVACRSGGTILIPDDDGTFVVEMVKFRGPCKYPVEIQVDGVLKATEGTAAQNGNVGSWFSFYQVEGLTIRGKGTLDGNGASAWPRTSAAPTRLPRTITMYNVKNATIESITSLNSKGYHFTLDGCDTITIQNINITAPGDSPNTDGIHVESSNNIQILDIPIATGDDCVSIGQGSTNVNVTRVKCGPGHGISIGSIGKYKKDKAVRGIHISNCSITSTTNGLRIKTFAPSPSITVSDVTYKDITVNNASYPIIIDQYYCVSGLNSHNCHAESKVQVENVTFIGITGTSGTEVAVDLNCSSSKPCQGILLNNINITSETGAPTTSSCVNADVSYTGSQIPSACTSGRTHH